MTIDTNLNKPVNSSVSHSDQLRNETKKFNRTLLAKSLVTLAALVAGIALIVFLSSHLLTFGVTLIIVSAFAFCYHYHQYTFLNGLYKRVADVLDERFPKQPSNPQVQ